MLEIEMMPRTKKVPRIYEGLSIEQIEKLLEEDISEYRELYEKSVNIKDDLYLKRLSIKATMEYLDTTDYRFVKDNKTLKAKITPTRMFKGFNIDTLNQKYPEEVIQCVTYQELNEQKFREYFLRKKWNYAHITEALDELREFEYGKPKVVITSTPAIPQ